MATPKEKSQKPGKKTAAAPATTMPDTAATHEERAAYDAAVRNMTVGDMAKVIFQSQLIELRDMPDVWPKLSEAKQEAIIERLRRRTIDMIENTVRALDADGRTAFGAQLESINMKDGKLKISMTLPMDTEEQHGLFAAIGGVVQIVVGSRPPVADLHKFHATPDQRKLALGHEYQKDTGESLSDELRAAEGKKTRKSKAEKPSPGTAATTEAIAAADAKEGAAMGEALVAADTHQVEHDIAQVQAQSEPPPAGETVWTATEADVRPGTHLKHLPIEQEAMIRNIPGLANQILEHGMSELIVSVEDHGAGILLRNADGDAMVPPWQEARDSNEDDDPMIKKPAPLAAEPADAAPPKKPRRRQAVPGGTAGLPATVAVAADTDVADSTGARPEYPREGDPDYDAKMTAYNLWPGHGH